MDSINKRVGAVMTVVDRKQSSLTTTHFTNFSYYSKFLVWLLRLYGVNMDEKDSARPIRFLYRCVTLAFLSTQLFNIYFNVSIAYGVVMKGEYEMVYVIIPAAMAIFRQLFSIAGFILRRRQLCETFGKITRVLNFTYKMSVADIRKRIRHLEIFVVVAIVVIFISGIGSRFILTYAIEPDLMLEKLNNITGQSFPQIYICIGQTLLTFGTLLEVISAAYFAAFCCLLSFMFDKEHFNVDAILKGSDGEAHVSVRERLSINCEMMEMLDRQFSIFLLGSFSFQIFTMCFWSRSITLDFPWIDLKYHLWIVHFIAVTSLSFGIQCWAAVVLNQKVCSSIRYVIKQVFLRPEMKSDMNDYFILLSLLTSPPQITAWNSFAVTKRFVLTVTHLLPSIYTRVSVKKQTQLNAKRSP